MNEIIVLALIIAAFFTSFIAFMVMGILRSNKRHVWMSLGFLCAGSLLGMFTMYRLGGKTYHWFKRNVKERTPTEIYTALYGPPSASCLEVVNAKDQLVPKLDEAIYLEFKTCPQELQRILSSQAYQFEKVVNQHQSGSSKKNAIDWFTPENLGDTILVFTRYNNGAGSILYCSQDSTHVYCKDFTN